MLWCRKYEPIPKKDKKPITSVATSIPGFLGLFEFAPKPDAIAISGSDGIQQITGKLTPQLVDKSGNFKGDVNEGATQLTESLGLKRSNVKNVKNNATNVNKIKL